MMNYHRLSIRLRGYDYSQSGAYFITFCAQRGVCLFGDTIEEQMLLNSLGEIVQDEWVRSAKIRSEIGLDEFVVMPNHFHAIVLINQAANSGQGAQPCAPTRRPRSLSTLVAQFKASTTRRINEAQGIHEARIWQRNFHDRVIRDDGELISIRNYIKLNSANWMKDEYHPSNLIKNLPC